MEKCYCVNPDHTLNDCPNNVDIDPRNTFDHDIYQKVHFHKIDYAYHVTNVVESEQKFYNPLIPHIADDIQYDGPLVGLNCIFFSTTIC